MHDCIHTRTRSSKVQPAEAYCGNGGKFEYNRKILSCDFHLVQFENKVRWVMNSVGWRIIIKKRFGLVAQERGNRIQGYAETACHVHEVD